VALAISWVLAALVAGSLVYCVLTLLAVRNYLHVRPPAQAARPEPVSILKPLHGVDEGLEENLRSFFTQDYPDFEILFAVRSAADPAMAVVERLRSEFPNIPAKLILAGEPPYANAKVYSLDRMMSEAAHDLMVMSDSDIRVDRRMLSVVAAEFQDSKLGVSTCPYRAVAGRSFWSQLEACGMNTEFWGGVLVARMLEGVKFAVGPTIVARKQALARIGGFDVLKDYLAEDFVMGARAAALGMGVELSSYVIEHRIGSEDLRPNFSHRLRWARSTRRSRPAGYIGQVFTNPFPLALALLIVQPGWWPVFVLTLVLRALAADWVTRRALGGRVVWRLLLLQDLLSLAFWLAGFFGNTIEWRGRRYRLLSDGRFELVMEPGDGRGER
jgi:ceramide glucosyltransferase